LEIGSVQKRYAELQKLTLLPSLRLLLLVLFRQTVIGWGYKKLELSDFIINRVESKKLSLDQLVDECLIEGFGVVEPKTVIQGLIESGILQYRNGILSPGCKRSRGDLRKWLIC